MHKIDEGHFGEYNFISIFKQVKITFLDEELFYHHMFQVITPYGIWKLIWKFWMAGY